MSEHQQLTCQTCNRNLDVWYQDNGAPFNHWYVCGDCKETEENESEDSL